MEYGIWNFHGGLWPTNNLTTFNGTTLTPITAATLPTNTASFAITAGLLNPIISAAAACNLNVFDTTATDNIINSSIEEQNSNDTNSSKFSEQNNNNNDNENEYDNEDDDDDDEATDNEATDENDATGATDNVNLVNSTNSSELIASDLSSNSYDDNATDNTIKINNNNQIHGFFAQQYAPVYNLVLGHFNNNPTTISVSETTDESSEDENTNAISTNENFTSTDNDNYTKQILNDQQPSTITTSTNTTIISSATVDNQQLLAINNKDEIHKCPVAGCEYKTVHIEILEQHVATHSEKMSKSKKITNMQRIRYEREEYHCSMCTYTCTTEKAYLRHLRMHSLGETPQGRLSCAVCGRDRIGETALAKHMRKHRDDRFFCCDICVFRTVQLKKLIQHRRMHTGEKPHLCPHCAYRSARRDNLRSHVRRVHKRDNLWCDTFSPRGMLLSPSTSKTIQKDSELSSETTPKNMEK